MSDGKQLDLEDVRYIARLARLKLTSAEEESMMEELGRILEYVDKLEEVDTEGVDPTWHASEATNVLRKDEREARITHEEALRNAPDADSEYFRVPKVIE